MMGETPGPPSTKTLVRGARQLLTLRGPAGPRRGAALGELGIVPDGAVLIRGGKILEAGPSRRVENLALARGAHEIDATGRVVMPGFVDSRTQPLPVPALPVRRLEGRAQSVLDGMARHHYGCRQRRRRSGLIRDAGGIARTQRIEWATTRRHRRLPDSGTSGCGSILQRAIAAVSAPQAGTNGQRELRGAR
jgi:hypothetical protein